jgi:hypothetical protein
VRYEFPSCCVLVDEQARYVETRFPDQTRVGATPNHDGHSLRMALDLGYPDTWSMSRDHELTHTWLAYRAGLAWSPTMWRLAHPDISDVAGDDEVAEEEALVLAFQQRLDKESVRPWDDSAVPVRRALVW